MSYSKIVKLFVVTFVFLFVLTACFSDHAQTKKDVNTAVENHLSRTNYTIEGSFTFNTPDEKVEWEWDGYVHQNQNELFLSANGQLNGQNIQFDLISSDNIYTHFPELNEQDEFFVMENTNEFFGENGIHTIIQELGTAAKETDPKFYRQTNEDNGDMTITIHIEDEHVTLWLDAITRALQSSPFTTTYSNDEISGWFENAVLEQPGNVTLIMNDQSQLTNVKLELEADGFALNMMQTFEDANTIDPMEKVKHELPWNDVMEQLQLLLERKQAEAEGIDMEQGIELMRTYNYPNDPDRQAIVDVITTNMQALIDKDKAAFDQTFRREHFVERHDDLWNSERKYRFLQIEDLQFKNLQSSVRVGVIYEYADPGALSVSTSAFTYTVNKNDQGEWKIDSIK